MSEECAAGNNGIFYGDGSADGDGRWSTADRTGVGHDRTAFNTGHAQQFVHRLANFGDVLFVQFTSGGDGFA